MSLDEAPVSSNCVRAHLLRNTTMSERVVFPLTIVTTVTRDDKAETVVDRPQAQRLDLQSEWNREIEDALHKLPGQFGNLILSGVQQTYTVTWDGVCRPI